jgi:histidinol dehydrogenase
MMTLRDLRGMNITRETAVGFVPRLSLSAEDVREQVLALMSQVRQNGETALREQAERFDGVVPASFVVEASYLKASLSALDKGLRRAMEESIRRVTAASEDSLPQSSVTEYHAGGQVVTRYRPVDRAGVYVPGGKAVYPSSVIMNVVAAQTAGVTEIALVSPGQKDYAGSIHPTIAAAAELLGVTEIYALGGAGAIGALAYGVPELSLAPVSVITGPGNRYVAAAKNAVRGLVGIDSEAGPTEIGIIADDTAHPEWVAADLISQAEHDELASAVLVTTSMELAERVQAALARQTALTTHSKRVQQALRGEQSAILVVDSLDHALLVSDALAPEHLEIMVEDPDWVVDAVRHAGAIFVGDYTPVSAGDYLAGSNHVLPTGGAARHSSGLSPLTFLRHQQVVTYDKAALQAVADHIVVFAEAENLPAHGDAVTSRFPHTPED